ncbi:hypothetical protein AGMMS49546_26380 [Spirochaetia bacterium]|nr:hypothetical protein AGMMS49546_26380 [Spirochaetia bacterium]
MKNKYIILLILTLGTIFLMASCQSTAPAPAALVSSPEPAASPAPVPEPVPPPAAQDVPDQAALNSLAAAKARAEEARKKAADFESPAYFPGEWDAAEAAYVSAGEQAQNTLTEVKQAEAQYNAAADSFEDVFSKTIPLYAQDREAEVIAARNEAISAGIDSLYPEHLRATDTIALDAVDKYEAGDYYAARDAAALSLGRYQALKAGMDSYNVRQEVLNRNFADYDPDNFDRADKTLATALDLFEAGNIEEALNEAEEAKLRYNLALKFGWAVYAEERALAAGKERQNALDLKANVAVRSEFDPAEKLYGQAGISLKAEKYEESADLYSQSEARFISLAKAAAEKRRAADAAIKVAEEKMVESEETARDAELILEGGAE